MISSIDSVLVRAAASSIASGRPSSERHRSCTASSASVAAPGGGATGEQLHGVGERERRELEHGLAVDVERRPGWCTGSAARGRRRGGGPRAPRRRRRRARSCRGSPPRRRALSRSSSAASPPVTFSAAITRVEDVVRRRRGFEPGQPDAAGRARTAADRSRSRPPSCRSRPARRSRRAAARASRSDRAAISVSRPTSSADSDGRFPAGARRSADARGAGSWSRICCSSCCSRGPGSRPSSSASRVADPLVGRQRVGLASRPVQRGDQQLPQAFLVRVGRHGRFQLADHVAVSRAAAAPRTGSRRASCAPRRAAPGAGRPSRRPTGSTSPR